MRESAAGQWYKALLVHEVMNSDWKLQYMAHCLCYLLYYLLMCKLCRNLWARA